MQSSDNSPSSEDNVRLATAFSEFRHALNNALAVMMALAEMTQRDPMRAEKLAASVLDKGRNITEKLREFTALFNEIVKPSHKEL